MNPKEYPLTTEASACFREVRKWLRCNGVDEHYAVLTGSLGFSAKTTVKSDIDYAMPYALKKAVIHALSLANIPITHSEVYQGIKVDLPKIFRKVNFIFLHPNTLAAWDHATVMMRTVLKDTEVANCRETRVVVFQQLIAAYHTATLKKAINNALSPNS